MKETRIENIKAKESKIRIRNKLGLNYKSKPYQVSKPLLAFVYFSPISHNSSLSQPNFPTPTKCNPTTLITANSIKTKRMITMYSNTLQNKNFASKHSTAIQTTNIHQ
jgi:hypothetical protein